MGFSYRPLFKKLVDWGMKKTDLSREAGLSAPTLARFSRGEYVSGETLEKLCLYFHCQPGDLFEYQFPDLPQGIQEPETVF
jgi:DNA-binding Xre family transcriptional regulator